MGKIVAGVILIVGLSSLPTLGAGKGESGPLLTARVNLVDRVADLQQLRKLDLDVDGVFDGWARVYLIQDELTKLERLGFVVTILPPEPRELDVVPPVRIVQPGQRAIPAQYHTYATLTSEMNAIAGEHPDLVRLSSIGQTPLGRELWMMKISDNPDVEEDEPEVAYIAAMHGDEVVGKELVIELIHYLLDNYGSDTRVTDLVDGSEIWIMPSMNPDGTESNSRYNANGFDLNRDFPDLYDDPVNLPGGRQPETRAVMNWVAAESISLSANFHGGALVANYPFDNNANGSAVDSPAPAPDNDMFRSIALTYSTPNTPMFNGGWPQGITNGAEWYVVAGGMQDWGYVWHGKYDLTLEVSSNKWPSASQLPNFWNENLESMLAYLERAQEGIRGLITDAATGQPVAASILIDSDPFAVYSDPDIGDYHRIVLPGSYSMQVSAPGFAPQTLPVTAVSGAAARYDLALQPLPADLQPVSARVDSDSSGDGLIDPGETVDLAISLKNLGNSATTVNARLIATTWYGNVLQNDAGYSDIANQQTVESDAPYYTILVDPTVPSGHKLGFAVEWDAAQGHGFSAPLFLDIGGPGCDSAAAADLPKAIADYSSTTSQIALASTAFVDELQISVDITHTYIGDLTLTLSSPAGTQVVLHAASGGSADDIVGTYGVDLNSAGSLATLAGEPAVGTWSLEVADGAGGDTGTLNSWSLQNCGHPAEAATPEMLLRGVGKDPGGFLVEWWPYPGILSYRVYRSTDPSSPAVFVDVTAQDGDATDTSFLDTVSDPLVYYLITGVGSQGEGAKGHFGQ